MKRPKHDFANSPKHEDQWYDLSDDWSLIEASFAKQYGIRLRQEASTMSWSEFCSLLSGLMPDTPLGQIVSIRCEQDQKAIKEFTREQKRIHSEWRRKLVKDKSAEENARDVNDLARIFSSMFGKKE